MQKILLIILSTSFLFLAKPISAETSLEPYCKNGYYEIPGEQICSRAPYCGGYGYDELNTDSKAPNPQSCMGDGPGGREDKGCAGYVPACCYEVARTGQFTKCIGYWERLWCAPSQCNTAISRGASDAECGDSCQCGHAFNEYCGNVQPVAIETRLGTAPQPTATPTNRPTGPTPTTPAGSTPTPTRQADNPTTTIPPRLSPAPTNTPAPPVPTKKYSLRQFVFRPTNTPTNTPQLPDSTPDIFPQQSAFQAYGQVIVVNLNNAEIKNIKVEIYKSGSKTPLAQQERVSGFFMPFLFADLDAKSTYHLDATVTTTSGGSYKQSNKCSTSSTKYRCLATPDSSLLEIEVQTKDLIPRKEIQTGIVKALEAPKQAISFIQQADNNLESLFSRIINSVLSLIDL